MSERIEGTTPQLIPDAPVEVMQCEADLDSIEPNEGLVGPPPDHALVEFMEKFGWIGTVALLANPDWSMPEGGYKVIDGRRRVKSARKIMEETPTLGGGEERLAKVPVMVFNDASTAHHVISVGMNATAKENPASDLVNIERLIGEGASFGEIAAATGMSVGTIKERLKLQRLITYFRGAYMAGNLSTAAARELARLSPERQSDLAARHREQGSLTMKEVKESRKVAREKAMEEVSLDLGDIPTAEAMQVANEVRSELEKPQEVVEKPAPGEAKVIQGECLEAMREMEPESVDSMLTDPPAGIGFMGAEWDSDKGSRNNWIAWLTEVMEEALRVMKPGAHGLVWALPKTSHWTAMALEDAGFEVRDRITHHFGTGFPKSANIGKALDKMAGKERGVIGSKLGQPGYSLKPNDTEQHSRPSYGEFKNSDSECAITAPATDAAKQWEGWGTGLKPATEDWWLIRKPLSESSIARNVVKHGTGAINVDGCRISTDGEKISTPQSNPEARSGVVGSDLGFSKAGKDAFQRSQAESVERTRDLGRFPANLILSHSPECEEECVEGCPVATMDEQSGTSVSQGGKHSGRKGTREVVGNFAYDRQEIQRPQDSGGASRFFYTAKPSKAERNAGLEGMPKGQPPASARSKPAPGREADQEQPRANHHPTVKPVKLMGYLVKLITPPEGTVLDPFAGSGTTGVAAIREGFDAILVEQTAEYVEIAKKRCEYEAGMEGEVNPDNGK